MPSDVDVCNLALGHVGDAANVQSISPPDNSRQAALCAQFYPIARDALLEMHSWGFATMRALLALRSDITSNEWQYVYEGPANVANYLRVLDSAAVDDFSAPAPMPNTIPGAVYSSRGIYTPQPFVVETDTTGVDLIYTNQDNALLIYSALVTDPTKFSPLFVSTLSYLLGSYLAGPLIKGQEGRATAQSLAQQAQAYLGRATTSDANQRRTAIEQSTAWIVNR